MKTCRNLQDPSYQGSLEVEERGWLAALGLNAPTEVVVVERRIKASPETVFRFFTDQGRARSRWTCGLTGTAPWSG